MKGVQTQEKSTATLELSENNIAPSRDLLSIKIVNEEQAVVLGGLYKRSDGFLMMVPIYICYITKKVHVHKCSDHFTPN